MNLNVFSRLERRWNSRWGPVECKRIVFVLSTVLWLSLSFAVGAEGAPELTIVPKLSTGWRVDSNYYWADSHEREVYTYTLLPGLEFGIQTAKSLLFLDFTLDAYYYDDKDPVPSGQRPSDEDDYVGHTGELKTRYRVFDRLLMGMDGSSVKTRDPAQSDEFSNSVDRDKYSINRLSPQVLYEFGERFTSGVRYQYTETDYDPEDKEDSNEHRGIFDLVYNFSPETSVDLEYQYWQRDYDIVSADYTSNQIKFIFRKQLNYFSFEAGGGYHDREFDDSSLQDIDVFTYRISIIGQNPPAPERRPRSHIRLANEQNFNDQGLGDKYFKANRISLDAGFVVLERLSVNMKGYYQESDYELTYGITDSGSVEIREDEHFDISLGIGYALTDWLTLSMTAGYQERDSNLAGLDYDNNYFMAALTCAYDLGMR